MGEIDARIAGLKARIAELETELADLKKKDYIKYGAGRDKCECGVCQNGRAYLQSKKERGLV